MKKKTLFGGFLLLCFVVSSCGVFGKKCDCPEFGKRQKRRLSADTVMSEIRK